MSKNKTTDIVQLKVRKIITVLIMHLIFLMQPSASYADSQSRILDVNSGLPAHWIRAIFRDSDGFMWFGSWEGLIRFDGEDFKVFSNDPVSTDSLSNNTVSGIIESSEGYLWIATVGGGLQRFDPQTESFVTYKSNSQNTASLSSDIVVSLHEGDDGRIWIGTWGGGLNILDPQTGKVIVYQHKPDDSSSISGDFITGIEADGRGAVWLLTRSNGINRFDIASGEITRLGVGKAGEGSHWGQNNITLAKDGHLWFVTRNYLNRLDPINHEIKSVHTPDSGAVLTGLLIDKSDRIWVHAVGPDVGLFQFDIVTDTFIQHSVKNAIFGGYLSPEGEAWFGTRDTGILILEINNTGFTHIHASSEHEHGYEGDTLRALHVDQKDRMWVVSKSALTSYDPQTGHYKAYGPEFFKSRNILDISELFSVTSDNRSNLWIGSTDWQKDQGLIRLNVEDQTASQYVHDTNDARSISSNSVLTGLLDADGQLWFGTDSGLNLYDRANDNFIRYYPNSENTEDPINNIRAIVQTSDGLLWTGSWYGGLHVFDPQKREFLKHYGHSDIANRGLSSDVVYSIAEGDNNDLWIGTASGLNHLDRTSGKISYYTSSDGLPSDAIMGIIRRDTGKYWISTRRGLSLFYSEEQRFQTFDKANGLAGDEYLEDAYAIDSKGNTYFGTTDGVNIIAHDWQEPPLIPANPTISDIRLNYQSLIPGESPLLPRAPWAIHMLDIPAMSGAFSLEFELAPRLYNSAEKIRYRYKLSPLNKRWIEVDSQRRTVSYTNLDTGDYVFEYSASDNLGRWPDKFAVNRLQVVVQSPWWAKPWFKATLLGLLALVTLLILRKKKNDLVRKQKKQEEIRKREENLRLLLNSTSQAFFALDSKGVCTIANNACATALAVNKPADLAGQDMQQYFITENLESYVPSSAMHSDVVKLNVEESNERAYTVFQDSQGRRFPVEFSNHLMFDNNKVTGCVINFSEATDKLEQSRQIQRAQKSEMIGSIVDGIVHDFNNNLNVMAMNVQMLEFELDDFPDAEPLLQRINTSLENASELSKRLLNLSISNQLAPRVLHLNTVVSEIHDVVEKTLGERITVKTVLSDEVLTCKLDLENLHNVILNLVLNAKEAIEAVGQVTISTEYVDTRVSEVKGIGVGEFAVLKVSDTGSGIPLEIRSRIFEPFVSSKAQGASSGLGLAIVNSFVQQSSGYIKIDSKEDKGTTFELYFPIVREKVFESVADVDDNDIPQLPFPGETILVVEDEQDNLDSLSQLLHKAGYNPLPASNVEDAIRLFELNISRIRLILTDIILPSKSDGRDLYIDLLAKKPELAAIFITGYAQTRDDSRLENIPTLHKPFKAEKLLKMIYKVLSSQAA